MAADHRTAAAVNALRQRLEAIESERRGLLAELARLQGSQDTVGEAREELAVTDSVNAASDATAKVKLFRTLFRGREDVFPRRWQNANSGKSGYSPVCRNEWVRGICEKPRVKCGECPHQAFVAVTDNVIRCHLQGTDRDSSGRDSGSEYIAGVYPLLPDETCWFLAIDFDKQSWQIDARAFVDASRAHQVDAALERSRSGQGAHVWIFFAEPVPAVDARKLGALLVTSTMERRPDIGFESYDRFFPSQDTRPAGGFGNLIALPFQDGPRRLGNSVFVDDEWVPYEDQWAYLSSVKRVSYAEVLSLVGAASAAARIVGVRFPVDDDNDEPWRLPPSRRTADPPVRDKTLPERVKVVLGNQVYVDRSALPAPLVARCIRLAAFQNPEFYAAQAMRLPTFGKPRVISCAELFPSHVALPRGSLDSVLDLLNEHGIRPDIQDERELGTPLDARFLGQLTEEQESAAAALLPHDCGVLAAATAFGKTVVASRVLAARGRNTLILVHRRQLMDQWVARLSAFLEIDPKRIGTIGGGKKKPTGFIDVALIQSLVRKGEVSDVVANYGHLIVDECHHLPAVSFEAVARQAKAKFVLGLSATVTRKDGHHPIVFMQCGPVRYRVDARKQAAVRPFAHKVVFRSTGFSAAEPATAGLARIQGLYGLMAKDSARNDLIFDDVLLALEAGRSPVILTERKDHLLYFADRLAKFAKNVIVFHGGMKAKAQKESERALKEVPDSEERVLLATGRYLGEGFDDARLDTLFLTMPISWRGLLSQYAGRLHRLHPTKRDVMIYDYVDAREPMLVSMSLKRRAGYRTLGYTEVSVEETPSRV
jgi:superfamily II DNA or RNA helicase